jgi:hypothetical protein
MKRNAARSRNPWDCKQNSLGKLLLGKTLSSAKSAATFGGTHMYCVNCGTPLTQGLAYCNRCGVNLKERSDTNTGAITAFLTAITLLGIAGLGIMLGGALVLRKGAGLSQELIGFFMLFTFLIVGITEFMLVRNLSKLSGENKQPKHLPPTQDLRLPQARPLGEPVSSVTDNTTRTLKHAGRDY